MKNTSIILILSFLLAACGPSPEKQALMTANASTAIAGAWTSTPEPTNTPAPALTSTPTPTPLNTPTATDLPTPTSNPITSFESSIEWDREFGSEFTDEVSDFAGDSMGNIYLACFCGSTGLQSGGQRLSRGLLKISGGGDLVWSLTGSPDLGDQAFAIDGLGNVILAGTGYPTAGGRQSFLTKFSADGDEIWNYTVEGSIADVAVDEEGNIYVAGGVQVESEFTANLSKYSPAGDELWTQLLNENANPMTPRVLIGTDGHVYAVGSLLSGALEGASSQGGRDIFIQTFSPNNDEAWSIQFGSDQNDDIADARFDSAGNLYVAYTGPGAILAKVDSSGSILWTAQFGEPSSKWIKLAIDRSQNIYLLLNHNWPYTPTASEMSKVDSNGNPVWVRVFPSSVPNIPELITTDRGGNIYVTGWTTSGDLFLVKFSP